MSTALKDDKAAGWEPLIVAFCCNWCSYAGGDLAGTSRMSPMFILRAFQRGADGVLVAGCHPGDCHYSTGNYHVRRRLSAFKRLVEFSGVEPERFEVRWISSSEGDKFAEEMADMTGKIKALGPNGKMRDARWQNIT